jgi:hypothetical protein
MGIVFALTNTKSEFRARQQSLKKIPTREIRKASSKLIPSSRQSGSSSKINSVKSIVVLIYKFEATYNSLLDFKNSYKIVSTSNEGIKTTILSGILNHLDRKGVMKFLKQSDANLRRK